MSMQEKLAYLLDKYSVDKEVKILNNKTVEIDNKEVPIFPHRFERRFVELRNIVNNGTLVGVSVMRVARIVEEGIDVFEELYREIDLCQFILNRKLKSITTMQNDNVINSIATTVDGIVCTIEIAATLRKGETPKDKHEIISQRGIACDVVVDAQLKQDSIYVFGDTNKKFTDVDFEIFGLSIEETSVVRAAFNLAQTMNIEENIICDKEITEIVEKAKKSVESGEREAI